MIIEDKKLRNEYQIFDSRFSAGQMLLEFIEEKIDLILAIPNGGVPVSEPLVEFLNPKEYNLLLIRKVHVPWTQEAGMGAITPDGNVFFNQQLIESYNIEEKAIERKVNDALIAIEERKKDYDLEDYEVENKHILLTDDGIASGFSMIAGATWLKEKGARSVTIAVPTAPLDSIRKIEELVDKIICLNVRTRYPFAVADAYKNWYDVPIQEVKQILKRINVFFS
ncbi:MAG: phosphoribosyltransferase [Candidatus Thorarchaeota archaeon]